MGKWIVIIIVGLLLYAAAKFFKKFINIAFIAFVIILGASVISSKGFTVEPVSETIPSIKSEINQKINTTLDNKLHLLSESFSD